MIQFRGSNAGGCLRSIVASILLPSLGKPTDEKILEFLQAGHEFQAQVVAWLEELGYRVHGQEKRVTVVGGEGWKWVGHVDASRVAGEGLEVKAITPAWFSKLKKRKRWWTLYPHYRDQVEVYSRGLGVNYPMNMLFINRATGEKLGGLEIEHEDYTHVENMRVIPDDYVYSEIVDRHELAVCYIFEEKMPQACSRRGCFFCGGKL